MRTIVDEMLRERERLRQDAKQIGSVWGDTDWISECAFEYSDRMSRSLGITYPERPLIRLNSALQDHPELRKAVLCHELAHLLCFLRFGRSEPAHGEAWQKLVIEAGGDPSARLLAPELPTLSTKNKGGRYRHYCPVCHASRTAKRRMPNWRCEQCIEQGLDGELVIEPVE